MTVSSTVWWTEQLTIMAPKRGATPVELALVQLRNCLVNLPPTLVAALGNSNTVGLSFTGHRLGCLVLIYTDSIRQSKMSSWNYSTAHPRLLPRAQIPSPTSNQFTSDGLVWQAREGHVPML